MNQSGFWKTRLTPFDAELFVMVESLTQKPCSPALDVDGGYFFEADYELHNDPQYILAIWDAICGRLGERLVSIKDDAGRHCLRVHVKFSERKYPAIVYNDKDSKPNLSAGQIYRKNNVDFPAIQVTWKNAHDVLAFVGCGEIERPENGKAMLHFRNAGLMVYEHAPESSYVVHISDGLFNVVSKEVFEREYERVER